MSDEELLQVIEDYNICLVVGDTPSSAKAFTFAYGDKYLVVVSSASSKDQQRKSFIHEVQHIVNGHFDLENQNVDELERNTRKETEKKL